MCQAFSFKVIERSIEVKEGDIPWIDVNTVKDLRALEKEYGFTLNDLKGQAFGDTKTDYSTDFTSEDTCLCPFDFKKILGIITNRAVGCMNRIIIDGM